MSDTPDTLLTYAAVQTWLQSLQQHGPIPCADRQERLRILAAFCEYVGQTPDAIIAACLRETPAGTAIRIGGRILLLSPHPGRVKAQIDSDGVDRVDASGRTLSARIHDLLFDEAPRA